MRKVLFASVVLASFMNAGFAFDVLAEAPDASQMQLMQERHAVMLEAHLAAMKAGLRLTAEQEKNWPAFEAAIRDAEKARADRWRQARERMSQGERPSPIERMTMMADHLQKMGAQLQIVADAGRPLYDSLTDAQKSVFGPLMREFKLRGGHQDGRTH
jgi:LTXXQ motif family protein